MKKLFSVLICAAIIFASIQSVSYAKEDIAQTGFDAIRNSLDLVWNDEFNDNSLDMTKWRFETPYSTAYEQVYCNSIDDGNVKFENGNLVIETRKETKDAYIIEDELGRKITTYDESSGGEKKTFNYTSARLYSNIKNNTDENAFKRGMIEAKIKTPSIGGIFSAFWTTGYDHVNGIYRTWPNTGEIDILESLDTNGRYSNSSVQQSIHYSYNNAHKNSLASYYSSDAKTGDEYHTFGIYYTQNQVVFYVDNGITGAYNISASEFDAFREYAQNLILNVAVGVNSATVSQNKVDEDFTVSQMYVDYVRVYQSANDDYSHINVINAEDCNYINASSEKYSVYNNPTVVKVKDSSIIKTNKEFESGTYDIYVSSLDFSDSGKFEFKINNVPTNTSVDFSDNTGAKQHYIGTAKLNEKTDLNLEFKSPDNSEANIDSLIIVANSTNKPNVILESISQNKTYSFEAENLTINSIKGQITTASYTEPAFKGKTFLIFDAAKAGAILKDDYIEFILPNVQNGAYKLITYHRMWENRSIFDISVNGQNQLQDVDFAKPVSSSSYEAINCGIIAVNESGNATLRFTVTSETSKRNAGFYMDKMELVPINDTKILTIDDTSRKVKSGISYKLPESDEKGFVAYTDGINFYSEGEAITVNDNILFTTIAVGEISMQKGAAIRLNEKNGIRFYTNIDKNKIAQLKADGYTIEFGTLIAPTDKLDKDELTFNLESTKFVDVKYKSDNYYSDSNGFSGIVGSIVNIKENNSAYSNNSGNITRDFVGRGYIKVSKDGKELSVLYASYADKNILNNTRSLKTVANALMNDTNKEAQALYKLKKALIDKWAFAEK